MKEKKFALEISWICQESDYLHKFPKEIQEEAEKKALEEIEKEEMEDVEDQ